MPGCVSRTGDGRKECRSRLKKIRKLEKCLYLLSINAVRRLYGLVGVRYCEKCFRC